MKGKFAVILMFTGMCVAAQRPKVPIPKLPVPTDSIPKPTLSFPGFFGKPQNPKPYKEIVTDKAVTKAGLFKVHKVDEKYYFEIGDTLLGREIMAVTRFVKIPSGAGYGGEIANQQTLSFEKGPSNTIFLRVITLVSTADSTNDIYKAVTNSNVNTIVQAFPVAAYNEDSTASIIDVTDFFKGDNLPVSIGQNTKRRYGLSGVANDRSYIQKISPYQINVEIRTVKTFFASGGSLFGLPTPPPSLPAGTVSGAVTIELNTSIILLPAAPMAHRVADKRVGYFTDNYHCCPRK